MPRFPVEVFLPGVKSVPMVGCLFLKVLTVSPAMLIPKAILHIPELISQLQVFQKVRVIVMFGHLHRPIAGE